MRNLAIRVVLLALWLPLAVSACGKKGPPLPPLRYNPVAAKDLTARQLGGEVVLSFEYPKTTVAGQALPALDAVEVWRFSRPLPPAGAAPAPVATLPAPAGTAAPPPAAPPPAAPVVVGPAPPDPREFAGAAEKIVTLRGAELAGAVVGDRLQARIRLEPGAPPAVLTFGVRTVAANGDRSEPSNLVTLVPASPPVPPTAIRVVPQSDGVLVSWAPVPGAAGFRIYRREAGVRGYGAPLATAEPAAASHLDATARFGQRYVYTVTTVTSLEPPVESALESESEVDYQDRYGPPAPGGILTLPEGGDVRLQWDAATGNDVAGYLVFRQDPGGEFHQVTAAPIAALEWLDRGLAPGNLFRYRVVAVDRAGNEGPPSAVAEALTR